jgi:hypothetical protein
MNDKRKKPPRRGVEFRFGPPESTRLPSPWRSPTPGAKEIIDKLDKLNESASVKRGRSKRRRKQGRKSELESVRKAQASLRLALASLKPSALADPLPMLRWQMSWAILLRECPDEFASTGTVALKQKVAKHWKTECKTWGVKECDPPSWDTIKRLVIELVQRQRQR